MKKFFVVLAVLLLVLVLIIVTPILGVVYFPNQVAKPAAEWFAGNAIDGDLEIGELNWEGGDAPRIVLRNVEVDTDGFAASIAEISAELNLADDDWSKRGIELLTIVNPDIYTSGGSSSSMRDRDVDFNFDQGQREDFAGLPLKRVEIIDGRYFEDNDLVADRVQVEAELNFSDEFVIDGSGFIDGGPAVIRFSLSEPEGLLHGNSSRLQIGIDASPVDAMAVGLAFDAQLSLSEKIFELDGVFSTEIGGRGDDGYLLAEGTVGVQIGGRSSRLEDSIVAMALLASDVFEKADAFGYGESWSTEPLNIRISDRGEVSTDVQFSSLVIGDVEFPNVSLLKGLKDGELSYAIAIDDEVSTVIKASNSSRGDLELESASTLSDYDVGPYFKLILGTDAVSGSTSGQSTMRTSGNSVSELVSSLSGSSSLRVSDGIVHNINLSGLLDTLVRGSLAGWTLGGGDTKFANLEVATSTSGGVVDFTKLEARGPRMVATGSGTINLPKREFDIDVGTKLSLSSSSSSKSVTVPVTVTGDLLDPDIDVQADDVVKGFLTSKLTDAVNDKIGSNLDSVTDKVEEAVRKKLGSSLSGGLKGLLGG